MNVTASAKPISSFICNIHKYILCFFRRIWQRVRKSWNGFHLRADVLSVTVRLKIKVNNSMYMGRFFFVINCFVIWKYFSIENYIFGLWNSFKNRCNGIFLMKTAEQFSLQTQSKRVRNMQGMCFQFVFQPLKTISKISKNIFLFSVQTRNIIHGFPNKIY